MSHVQGPHREAGRGGPCGDGVAVDPTAGAKGSGGPSDEATEGDGEAAAASQLTNMMRRLSTLTPKFRG